MVMLTGFGASAQDSIEVIEARQAIMQFVGSNMRTLAAMQRGQAEFNVETARATGQAISVMLMAFPHLFPEGTETGGSTEASPAIFDDQTGFREAAFALESAAGKLAGIGDAEQFGAAFGDVGATCRSCHSLYRQ